MKIDKIILFFLHENVNGWFSSLELLFRGELPLYFLLWRNMQKYPEEEIMWVFDGI